MELGMKRIAVFLSLLLSILAMSPLAHAVPNLISYQGVLNDQNGHPVTGTVNITFRIFDVDTAGTALWNETQSVQVETGLFNVKLGFVQQLPASVFDSDSLYLGIQVGADAEMVPRQQITSGPFAQKSATLDVPIPIGIIMAWVKSMPGMSTLPEGWVECNGQTLADSASLLDGQIIPDLNGTQSLLKGSSTSGLTGMIANSSTITDTTGNHGYHAYNESYTSTHPRYLGNHSHSLVTTGMTNSYEIVWIMKIK